MKKTQIAVLAALVASTFATEDASAQMATQVANDEFTPKSLNINGEVGLPLNPTAQLPDDGEIRVQGNYYDIGKVKNPVDFEVSEASVSALVELEPGLDSDENIADYKYYGLFGAGRAGERLEISGGVAKLRANGGLLFSIFEPFGGGGEEEISLQKIEIPDSGVGTFVTVDYPDLNKTGFALGAKYLIKPAVNADDFAVAAGIGLNTALADNVHAYLVASKGLTNGNRAIKAHIGVRYDRFKLSARRTEVNFEGDFFTIDSRDFRATSSKVSAFVGAEVPIDSKGRFTFVGEFQSRNTDTSGPDSSFFGDGSSPYSLSLRYAKDKVNASVGVQRQGVIRDSGLFAQVGYAF